MSLVRDRRGMGLKYFASLNTSVDVLIKFNIIPFTNEKEMLGWLNASLESTEARDELSTSLYHPVPTIRNNFF